MTSKLHALNDLTLHYQNIASMHMAQLFAADPLRFERFSLQAVGLLLDYSKNRITSDILNSLILFAENRGLPNKIEDLFYGVPLNNTEQRPALHTALRDPMHAPIYIGNTNIAEEIQASLAVLENWITRLQNQTWLGYAKKPITDVVHISIGGSHLGPVLACEAFATSADVFPRLHFVSSIDPIELNTVLKICNPETTLFVVASKTYTTQETLHIAASAKAWLLQQANGQDISQHFIAATANKKNALVQGISPDLILPMWDWVGGRFSVWSAAMGLPVALKIGMPKFKAFLQGAYQMDQHFRTAPLQANMPVILGLLSFWYIHFFKTTAQAILPYDYRLRALPRYLQQLEMESNGKRVQKNGEFVQGFTAPVIFGDVGTNGQHSFYQLLHQGTHLIPCDFIAALDADKNQTAHQILLAHCLAQSRGLMLGNPTQEVGEIAAQKAIMGNQPSNTILMNTLDPHTLGALMALYEHKTFVEGVLWSVNSFDQWGVALGKEIANELLDRLRVQGTKMDDDNSTQGLLNYIFSQRNKN